MPDRDQMLKTIDEAYAARVRGDKDALARFWAPGASFRISADAAPLETLTLESDAPMEAIGRLIDRFTFSDLERVSAVVEGNGLVIRWNVTIVAPGQPPHRTELTDMIEFGDDGLITAFVQYADTASILRMLNQETVPAE